MTRLAAWALLRSGAFRPLAEVARVAAEHGLDERDRRLLRAMVGVCLRRRGSLLALVRHFARGRPSADVATHLHVGLAQIFFLDRIPDHAAVSETVRATADSLGLAKGRYVNGVLRSALRARRSGESGDPTRDLPGRDVHVDAPVFRDPDEHPFLWIEDALNVPAPLAKRWTKRYGIDETRRLAACFLTEPELSVRVVAGTREEALASLAALGCEPRPGSHPAIALSPARDAERVVGSEPFRAGRLTVQGEAALRAAEAARVEAGERVLDLCAAPGGKTAVLAGAGAEVVACDKSAARGAELRATIERLRLAERVRFVVTDGAAGIEGGFDAVLADAPCSNTGVLGARPSARWRYGPKERASLLALQGRLLEEGAARVRPGGRLVWSTCSLEPEENGQLVRAFLAEHAEFSLDGEAELRPMEGGAGPVDGGYSARLVRG